MLRIVFPAEFLGRRHRICPSGVTAPASSSDNPHKEDKCLTTRKQNNIKTNVLLNKSKQEEKILYTVIFILS